MEDPVNHVCSTSFRLISVVSYFFFAFHSQIKQSTVKLTEISDFTIIMEDPLVIQPSSLELVTLKKRENDVGFLLMSSNCGIQRYIHKGRLHPNGQTINFLFTKILG
jgi:hypothetical protein